MWLSRDIGLVLLHACVVFCQVRRLPVSIDSAEIKSGTPLDGFISYSIEFASFPEFAGNKSSPNQFSDNLLNNIGYLQGDKPYIRVGGNTQDYAIYNANLTVALNGTVNVTRSPDYPTTIEIGPSFFESYSTWPNVKFSHGFNMGGNNNSRVQDTLTQTAELACKALGTDKLYVWEYGNEADLFATSAQGPVRPPNYNETDYVNEWLDGTAVIKSVIQKNCPDLASINTYKYMAPSFAGVDNHLKAPIAWADGLDNTQNIKYFSSHNYISGANTPGVTLQGTLMNHTRTRLSIEEHVDEYNAINPGAGVPHIMGEANSLYNQGRPGLSNSFGAALWGIDFALYCAALNIRRVHMHMGTDYRYASWQPVETPRATRGTKAPYYGNIAVAAFLGNLRIAPVQVAHLPLTGSDSEAAYAAYVGGTLKRVMIINMSAYNYTTTSAANTNSSSSSSSSSSNKNTHAADCGCDGGGQQGSGSVTPPPQRPVRAYSFFVGGGTTTARVQRLYANGSDAITGITWDGWSYNYELDEGRPVRLANVTIGETVQVQNGTLNIVVPDSQAVLVTLGVADETLNRPSRLARRRKYWSAAHVPI
ncbi:glycoside hydrolase family 79 protein [Apiospora arundinis]|uniref:Glycoside hydrolase family 79 protein n=1 Tax=Apiospora arundinis TaxID=335852 RepID=A0ABR2HR19_9PEZI